MKVKTKYLGEIEISEEDIIHFSSGLMGLEEHKEYIIQQIPNNPHFTILQDVKNAYIGFIMVNPWDFFLQYDIEIPDNDLKKIQISDPNQMVLYNIVTMGKSLDDSTVNLLAPIVINIEQRVGQQFIINESQYTTKHPLLQEKLSE